MDTQKVRKYPPIFLHLLGWTFFSFIPALATIKLANTIADHILDQTGSVIFYAYFYILP
ncbi:hypothetical protein [Dyadobacter sp. NIV53]|uniref:hypothetical protein n=1 Tax=Dyadobacter sp. NIV53 TaxID=2861765 RepID=UPI001E304F54|nr:hypothetical protein [Dyadobacter sp. NIV53]